MNWKRLVGEPLQEEGITTVSGWVTQRLGGFPKLGDVLAIGACELRVEEMAGMRVARLKLTRKQPRSLRPVKFSRGKRSPGTAGAC